MIEHQYYALKFAGEEAFCVISPNGARGPHWALGPKFLNNPDASKFMNIVTKFRPHQPNTVGA